MRVSAYIESLNKLNAASLVQVAEPMTAVASDFPMILGMVSKVSSALFHICFLYTDHISGVSLADSRPKASYSVAISTLEKGAISHWIITGVR